MEILDKKSNRMSRANSGVFECNEFPDLQRILDFLSLRNLLSNELFFTFYYFATAPFYLKLKNRNLVRIFSNLISIAIFIKWRPQCGLNTQPTP